MGHVLVPCTSKTTKWYSTLKFASRLMAFRMAGLQARNYSTSHSAGACPAGFYDRFSETGQFCKE